MKIALINAIIFCCVICFSAQAQSNRIKFNSINSGGIAIGESGSDAVFQTINGVSNPGWFFGAGIGIDYYQYKTLPLFFDVRKFFGKNGKGFVYGDAGYNFTLKNKPGKDFNYFDTYSFKGGIYTDFGIGIKTKLIKSSSLLFSLGHSYKELRGRYGVTICPFAGPCYVDYSDLKFSYGKIILKAGVEF